MKQFNNVGYRPYRSDNWDYGKLHFEFLKMSPADQDKGYGDGDILFSLDWITSMEQRERNPWHCYWIGPSVAWAPRFNGGPLETINLAVKAFQFISKWFGHKIDYDIAMGLVGGDDVDTEFKMWQAQEALKSEREIYHTDGYWANLQPEILAYIGLPAMNIPRVVDDARVNRVIPVNDMLSPNTVKWMARYDDLTLAVVLADSYEEAQDKAEAEARAEWLRIKNGVRPLEYVWGKEDIDRYEDAFSWWMQLRHVTRAYGDAPDVAPINELLDVYERWQGIVRY